MMMMMVMCRHDTIVHGRIVKPDTHHDAKRPTTTMDEDTRARWETPRGGRVEGRASGYSQ
jgi:hypothetical protein